MTADRIIRDAIQAKGGVISFAEFMEMALYHPKTGYYTRQEIHIGEQGDFYTSPTLHPIFAQLIAKQLENMWERLGRPDPFCLQEWGAGNARLSVDLLLNLQNRMTAHIDYTIVEKSLRLQEIQRQEIEKSLKGEGVTVNWRPETELTAGSFRGVILSNELFDALPVNRYQVQDGKWIEVGVTYREGQFSETPLGSGTEEVDWLNAYLSVLEDGDRADVTLQAGHLMRKIASILREGYILTIDYGDVAPEVYEKARFAGNIRAYYKMTLSYDFYRLVGEQDLTADVNFSLLKEGAVREGARLIGWSTQALFLEKLGFLKEVQRLQRMAFHDLKYDFELQTMLQLYVPTGLGEQVKVLAVAKGSVPDELIGF